MFSCGVAGGFCPARIQGRNTRGSRETNFRYLLPGRLCEAGWPLADGRLAVVAGYPLASQGLCLESQLA
jgi:hypothetical protein